MSDLDTGITPPEGTVLEPQDSSLTIDPIKSPGDVVEPPAQAPISETVETVVEPESEPEKSKKEGRVRRFFRNLLRWTLSILILFGIGFLVAVFVLYRPEVASYQSQLDQAKTDLVVAQDQLSASRTEYENQIADLENQVATLTPLAVDNEGLLAMQDGYLLQIAVLDARLDVANAQLAIGGDDTARARVMLTRTADTLKTIGELLPENQKDVAASMEQRLTLVLDELEDDPFAAQSDLDVLEKSLLELEDALFGE